MTNINTMPAIAATPKALKGRPDVKQGCNPCDKTQAITANRPANLSGWVVNNCKSIIYGDLNKPTNKKNRLKTLLLLALFGWLAPLAAQAQFGGGSGTAADPFIISTTEHMTELADKVNTGAQMSNSEYYYTRNYRLDADLDYTGKTYTVIGKRVGTQQNTSYRTFSGVFDGNGHTISNVEIGSAGADNQALFGCISPGCTIKNLTLGGNSTITGNNNVGGIVGFTVQGGTSKIYYGIIGCAVGENVVVSGNSRVGGIAGDGQQTKVTNCISFATVNGNSQVGSVVGYANEEKVFYCYYGNPEQRAAIGDWNTNSGHDTQGKAELATSRVSANGMDCRIVGTGMAGAYYNGFIYSALNDEVEVELQGFPIVYRAKVAEGELTPMSDLVFEGEGTEESPLLITKIGQLNFIALMTNGTTNYSGVRFRLDADLDYKPEDETIPYYPIGSFAGHFDGANHVIKNVRIEEQRSYVGLFREITGGGTVERLITKNFYITGTDYVGGITGCLRSGTVKNCVAAIESLGWMHGIIANEYVGGIVGFMSNGGNILNCLSLVNNIVANADMYYGNIAGNMAGNITNNYYGSFSGTNPMKGIGTNDTPTDFSSCRRAYKLTAFETGQKLSKVGGAGIGYEGIIFIGANESVQFEVIISGKKGFMAENYWSDDPVTIVVGSDGIPTATMEANPYPENDIQISGELRLALLDNDAEAEYNNRDRVADHVEETLNVLLQGRTFHKDGTWNTLVLPFGLATLAGTPLEGAEVRTVESTSFADGTLTINLTEPLDAIEAGYPYLLRWPNGDDISNPVFTDVTLQDDVEPLYFDETGLMFYGFYYSDSIYDGAYNLYMGSDDKLHYPHAPMPIHSCRAYFSFTDIQLFYDVNRSEMNIGDETVVSLFPAIIAEGNWNDPAVWNTNPIPSPVGEVAVLAEATIPANCTAQAEEIVFLNEGALTIKDGGQLYHNNVGIRATIEKDITAYTPNTKDGYHLIGHSFADNGAVSEMDNLLANDYDLYYYDEPTHYWMNQKQTANNFTELEAAKGYLYANSVSQTIGLKGTLNAANALVTIPLSYEADALKGFNLVGNPFAHNVTTFTGTNVATEVFRMNGTKDNLMVSTISATDPLTPGEGFFVKATGNGASITFNAQTRGGAKATELAEVPTITLNLTQNGLLVDRFILKRDGEPLEKFTLNGNATRIYATHGGKDYAVATVGRDAPWHVSTTDEIPINFKAAKNGTYTLTFDTQHLDLEYLHLIDNLTGNDVDLLPLVIARNEAIQGGQGGLNQPSYTFTAKTTNYASRFRLVFSTPADETSAKQAFAYFADGEIRLVETCHGASLQVVDVMGRVIVSTGGHTRCVPTDGMTPGVYILRLFNGDNVKTQKIVIE